MVTFELIDWSVALTPVLLMAALFAWLDVFKLMSAWEMIGLLLARRGRGAGRLAAERQMLDTLPMGYSFYSRIVAPWIEEALKGLALALLFVSNRIGFKIDAVISGFAIGAGFSVIENIFYLARFPELATAVWLVRGLGTAVMHGATTAILAVTAHELGERSLRRQGGQMFNLLVAGARLPGGQPVPPRLQPVPEPSDGSDDRHAGARAGRTDRPDAVRRRGDPAMAGRGERGASPLARGLAGRRLSRPMPAGSGLPRWPRGQARAGGVDPRLLHRSRPSWC